MVKAMCHWLHTRARTHLKSWNVVQYLLITCLFDWILVYCSVICLNHKQWLPVATTLFIHKKKQHSVTAGHASSWPHPFFPPVPAVWTLSLLLRFGVPDPKLSHGSKTPPVQPGECAGELGAGGRRISSTFVSKSSKLEKVLGNR